MEDQKNCRKSIRLQGYDYTKEGTYFVTVCTNNHYCLFGKIIDDCMKLSVVGDIVADEWQKNAAIRDQITLGPFVVMPNHIHGILVVDDNLVQEGRVEQFGKPVAGSLPTIVRSFKAAVTRRMNRSQQTAGNKLWQRGYYEHVIRDEASLSEISKYIEQNPMKWEHDKLFKTDIL